MSRGNLDTGRCEVFDDRDRAFDGGWSYTQGLPLPCDSDPKSIHSYAAPAGRPGVPPTTPRRMIAEQVLALREEMRLCLKAEGMSYARLAQRVGISSGDALHVKLYRDSTADPGLCRRIAAVLGRPDLAARLEARE